MKRQQETPLVDEREEARRSSGGGFAFLLVNGLAWIVTGLLALVLPARTAALILIWIGLVSTPLSFALQRWLRFPPMSTGNSLTPLLIQVSSVQLLALPAIIIVYALNPLYVPAAFAAVVGGHFLPYIWLQKTRLYGVLAAIVSLAPYLLLLVLGANAFYVTNFVVGVTLVVFAFLVRRQVDVRSQ